MASTGFIYPTTVDVSNNLTNPSNALASDNAYATADIFGGDSGAYVEVSGFDFASLIPSDATLDGIEIAVEGYTETSSLTLLARLNNESDHQQVMSVSGTEDTQTDGGPSDDWLGFTLAEIRNASFSVRVWQVAGSGSAGQLWYLDSIAINAYYTPAGGDQEVVVPAKTFTLTGFTPTVTVPSGWYDTDWAYRIPFTVPASEVASDLTDFPITVTNDGLPASFFTNVQSDGGDIVVTDYDGNKLPLELVHIDTASSELELYFKDDLSSTVNNQFYIYYGNATATETNSTNTWNSNYLAVYHHQDTDGTANSIEDSTSNNRDGDPTSMNASNLVEGAYGGGNALNFDGTSDYYDLTGYSFNVGNSFTLSAWVNGDTFDTGDNAIIAHDGTNFIFDFNDDDSIRLRTNSTPTNVEWPVTTTSYEGVWSHVTVVSTGSVYRLYVNGVLDSQETPGTAPSSATVTPRIGARNGGAGAFDGQIDEVRIYNGVLSADWIATEYANQNDPANFYTVGAEEDAPTAEDQVVNVPSQSFTLTGFAPSVVVDQVVNVPSQSFTLTGFAPSVVVDQVVNVPSQSFTLTGFAPSVVVDQVVNVPSQSFTLTGFTPTVEIIEGDQVVNVPSQSFTLTGFAPDVSVRVNQQPRRRKGTGGTLRLKEPNYEIIPSRDFLLEEYGHKRRQLLDEEAMILLLI
jgi:hypothetical protein